MTWADEREIIKTIQNFDRQYEQAENHADKVAIRNYRQGFIYGLKFLENQQRYEVLMIIEKSIGDGSILDLKTDFEEETS